MAQLLVMNRDNTHSDPAMSQKGCYKQGDVVVVVEDTHQFSAREQVEFNVISVPGPAADYAYLAVPDVAIDLPPQAQNSPALAAGALANGPHRMIRRRRYRYTQAGPELKPNA